MSSSLRGLVAILSAIVLGMPTPVAAQSNGTVHDSATTQSTGSGQVQDSAQVVLQGADISPDGRLAFGGHGFLANEPTAVTVEDDQGRLQARLDSIIVDGDGQINTVAVSVPGGLAPGPHTLRITGQNSGRLGRAVFQLQWQPPTVQLDAYTGKPLHTFRFTGSGFVPGEQVDLFLGTGAVDPLATVAADGRGEISGHDLHIPLITPGDYRLAFIGHDSRVPVSVGFNVQGFHPWAVLENYYVAPQAGVGFSGVDFVPGEVVQVYLNSRLSQPVAQVTADTDGGFRVRNAFNLPDLTGNNQLMFVGQQSQTEVTATFAAATAPPSTP
jgi:hypothetical protein